jgi:hypothetical protein
MRCPRDDLVSFTANQIPEHTPLTPGRAREARRPRQRTAIVVVGVGRSGTSALTRACSLLGAALPKDVLGPGRGNERGHWEPIPLADLNETILMRLGRNARSAQSLPAGWFESGAAETAIRYAEAVLLDQYGAAPLIVIKDPRLCLLLPVTLAALQRQRIKPCVVLPVRHPAEVVSSYWRRDGADGAAAESMWIRHMIEAEAASRSCPRVWVTFDALLADWRATLRQIAGGLGIGWPRSFEEAAPEVESFLSPRLRHFDVRASAAPLAAGRLATRLWTAAGVARDGDETPVKAVFDDVRMVIEECARLPALRSPPTSRDPASPFPLGAPRA